MDVFDLFARISIDISEYERGLEKARKSGQDFSKNLEGFFSGAKNLAQPAVKAFQSVESVGQKAGNIIKKGVMGFAAASTVVAGFGGSAVQAGMSFDSAMSQVAAVSGATGDEFDSLRKKAIEMGAKTKFSASEAAEAMNYMAMAGWKTEDMLDGISGIMNLAAASGEDLASTSDIVTDALTAFGMSASESGHFADILAVASSNANTNVGMMGETFKYVAPLAGAMGYSAEDTALAIGLMANSGIKASQAGTSLRSILTRLAKPTKDSQAAMDALGISITNSDGSMKSLDTVIGDLRTAFSGLSAEEKTTYAAMLGGQEAMSGLLAIVNAAPADVDKLTSSIAECNGAAEKMAATMMDNLAGDVKLFQSALESLKITVSDALTPTLRDFTQFGTKAMEQLTLGFQKGGIDGFFSAMSDIISQAITFLAEKAPEFVKVSMKFVASLVEGILNSQGSIFQAANDVLVMLADGLSSWLSTHGEELYAFGNRLLRLLFQGFLTAGDIISENIGKFIPLLVNAFLSYHEALFTVGMDILGAIGRGLVENKDKIMEMASETVRNITISIGQNAPAIIDGAIVLLEALGNAFMENWPLIAAVGTEIIAKLVQGISSSTPTFIAAIGLLFPHITKIIDTVGSIGGVVGKVVDFVTGGSGIGKVLSIGKTLMSGISGLFSLITAHPIITVITAIVGALIWLWNNCEEFREAVKAIWDAIVGFFQAAGKAIQEAWSHVVEFFQGVWDGIVNVFKDVGKWFTDVFTAAWNGIKKAWNAAVGFFKGIWQGIVDVFQGAAQWFGNLFSQAWAAIKSVWDAVAGFFSGIAEGIRSVFSSVMEAVSGFFTAAWEAVKGAWNAAVDFFSGIWEGISGIFQGVADWFGSIFSGAWEAVTSAWSGVKDFFSGIWETITGAFSKAWDVFTDIGGNIVKGLWNGITSLAGWLWDKVSGWVQSIWDGVLNFFDIHSPSGKSEWAAQMYVRGWGKGFDKYGYLGIRAVERFGENVTDAFDPKFDFPDLTPPAPIDFTAYARSYAPGEASDTTAAANATASTVVNIYSPKAVDPIEAAREWRKTTQQLAMGF